MSAQLDSAISGSSANDLSKGDKVCIRFVFIFLRVLLIFQLLSDMSVSFSIYVSLTLATNRIRCQRYGTIIFHPALFFN